MRDHRKLEVFQLADSLTLNVYAITRKFPGDERYGLTSQLRRAAVSIGANIVEGCARATKPDYIRFLGLAYSSARELEYELSIAKRLGYLSSSSAERVELLALRTCRALHGLIRALEAGR